MSVLAAVDVGQTPHPPISVGYDLATAYDDTLVVLYVMSDEEFDRWRRSREELPDEFRKQGYSVDQAKDAAAVEAADAVDATLETYDRERVVTRGRVGTPADEIIATAEEIDPSYVIVGGRKRSLAKQAIFGSVSQAVVRNAEQPVVTLMEQPDE